MIYLDSDDLKRLIETLQRAPGRLRIAAVGVLNDYAFGVKTRVPKILDTEMTIRNPRFVAASVRVVKATRGHTVSEVGSINRPRFTGWAEQELGARDNRARTITLSARGGDGSKKVPKRHKLFSGTAIPNSRTYAGRSPHMKALTALYQLRRQGHKKAFILDGHRRLPRGLYIFQGRNLVLLQNFEKKPKQAGHFPWLRKSEKAERDSGAWRRHWGRRLEWVIYGKGGKP